MKLTSLTFRVGGICLLLGTALGACLPAPELTYQEMTPTTAVQEEIIPTPLPTRAVYEPGQLVDYTIQDGDTIQALAARFNTSIAEILKANPVIPQTTTTLPPGMPVRMPIYYLPLWGSPYQILPDALFVNGPAQRNFDAVSYVDSQPGWLKDYSVYAYGGWRRGGELVNYIGMSYSVSPRLLLAILEYRSGALSDPQQPANADRFLLGNYDELSANLYYQLLWLADTLNSGYYRWIDGTLLSHDLMDGSLERFDPWENAATVALQNYYGAVLPVDDYKLAISGVGLAQTYQDLFGNIWTGDYGVIMPGSLEQPSMTLPFMPEKAWSYTGAPHPVWGEEQPWAAVDFAPPSDESGCFPSAEWVTAVADGVLSRTEPGLAILDLDGDGDERTGWVVLYLHLAFEEASKQGRVVKAGDVIGHPSCERGKATGTHVHIARKYNGQWVPADSYLPFNMEGWIPHSIGTAYKGTLTRNDKVITASSSGGNHTTIYSER